MQAGELTLTLDDRDAARQVLGEAGHALFEQLMAAHRERVLRTAYRLLGSMEDAHDVSQEVFLRLFKHLDKLDAPPQSWLYRVTVNLCHDHHRRGRFLNRRVQLGQNQPGQVDPADPAPSVEGTLELAVEMNARKRLLTAGLRRLTDRERAALVLRDIEGLSTREVAQILSVEEVTVRTQCAAARAKLARYVQAASRSPHDRRKGTPPAP